LFGGRKDSLFLEVRTETLRVERPFSCRRGKERKAQRFAGAKKEGGGGGGGVISVGQGVGGGGGGGGVTQDTY